MKKIRKIYAGAAALCLCMAALAGCGAAGQEKESAPEGTASGERAPDIVGGIRPDASKLRVGGSVSDAYVNPDELPEIAPEDIKAKGYEYDYGALTYELVWSDEFDYEGPPDSEKWFYDTGGSGWGNHELQYYTEGENAWVSDGCLTIEARRETYENCGYTSARLLSGGEGNWTYGKFEIYAKLPEGRGTWPAVWMLPTDWEYGDWPSSGEIDIMEHVGYDQDRIHGSVHTKSYNHSIGTQKSESVQTDGASGEFHLYALEWLPDKIIISADGEAYFTFQPTAYKQTPTFAEWPFDKRFHLLLNIAVGGDWGGAMGVDESVYPQRMVVDYVRVYQSPKIQEFANMK